MELRDSEFWQEVNEHIRLIQRADGLTFGTDAYLLAAYVRPRPRAVAVDLGSGTGIIPLLCLTRCKAARFTAIEVQADFCDLIRRNAALNGMDGRIAAIHANVRDIRAEDIGGEVDLVTANPPYMAPGVGVRNQSDAKYLARHEVAGDIGDFCAAAGRLLKHGGRFVCVFRPERMADLMAGLRAARLEPKRMTFVHATQASSPSLLLLEAVKGAAPSLLLTPPLCLHVPAPDTPRRPLLPLCDTADTAYIYENCAFPPAFLAENRGSSTDTRKPRKDAAEVLSDGRDA